MTAPFISFRRRNHSKSRDEASIPAAARSHPATARRLLLAGKLHPATARLSAAAAKAFCAKAVCIEFALVLASLAPLAAAPSYTFRHFTTDNGLSSNLIRALVQTTNGLIWIGTSEGLDSFDGNEIIHHRNAAEGMSVYVNTLFEDSEERLWVGTDDALYRLDGGNDFIRMDSRTPQGAALNSIVTAVSEDQNGNLWIATRGQGVFRYHPASDGLAQYLSDPRQCQVECLLADSHNQIWACLSFDTEHLYKYNHSLDKFEPARVRYEGCRPGRITDMAEDEKGNLWLGTWDQGLYGYDRREQTVRAYLNHGSTAGLKHLHSLTYLKPGEFLVGSDDGLLWISPLTGESRLFTNQRYDPRSLSDKFVYPVLRDRENGIWAGSYYGGINYAAPNASQFERYSVSDLTDSEETYLVSCLCEAPDGSVWVGSDNGGLIQYFPQSGAVGFRHTPGHPGLASYPLNVHSLLADGPYIWIGTYGEGLRRLDTRSGHSTVFSQMDGLDRRHTGVYALFKDCAGDVWIGATDEMFRYNHASGRFERMKVMDETVLSFVQTADGDVWAGTSGKGIFRYCAADGSWKRYSRAFSGLPSEHVSHLCLSRDGSLWAGTEKGLCRYEPGKDAFADVGLSGAPNVLFIACAGDELWISTRRGLLRYTPATGQEEPFDYSDGLASDHYMSGAGLTASDGKIYLGTTRGFNAFYPHLIYYNTCVPPVLITRFQYQDRSRDAKGTGQGYISPGFGDDPQHRAVLGSRQNNIRFTFTALSYCAPAKNQYAYRLEGFEREWRQVGSQTSAEYTNLPPGRYRFHVKASNNDGLWNETGDELAFVIRPPLLLSAGALAVYVLLAVGWLVLAIRWLMRRSDHRYRTRYEQLTRRQEAEALEARIRFATAIAHEVRTPLSLIIAPIEKLKNQSDALPESARSHVDIIDRNSQRLLGLINQLLDFGRITSDSFDEMHFETVQISELVRGVTDRFLPTVEKRGIDFDCQFDDPALQADVDREALTKILSNLLTNAVKYTHSQIKLRVWALPSQGTFRLSVADNGIGLSESEKSRLFTPFFRADHSQPGTGLGLSIVRRLVAAMNGHIDVRSAKGDGSTFTVSLPLSQTTASPRQDTATEQPSNAAEPEQEQSVAPRQDSATETALPSDTKSPQADARPRLLLVEDDEDMLRFLSDDLSDTYRITAATDGLKAKALLQEHDFDIIISDWMMPGLSGDSLCRFVRSQEKLCHIPFILLTARADDSAQLEGLQCGADAHVRKPFSPEHLRALAAHQLDLRRMLARKYAKADEQEPTENPATDQFLERFQQILEANISNVELSIDLLAGEMCVSRSGLFAKIKAATGTTPNHLILETRLKAAAKLLRSGRYTINEVSYMVGFNSPSYFTKCFIKQFGVAPHVWMKQ